MLTPRPFWNAALLVIGMLAGISAVGCAKESERSAALKAPSSADNARVITDAAAG